MRHNQAGIAGIFVILFIFLLLTGGLIGLDLGYIYYNTHCEDADVIECFTSPPEPSPTPNPETIVTATGSFEAKGYGVTLVMNVPLESGTISGSFDGDCQGVINGTYDDQSEAVSGTATGSCNPFVVPVPASATFTGTVDKTAKIIPINGTGSAAGFSGSGSITLRY
jgi:hypothetical protein